MIRISFICVTGNLRATPLQFRYDKFNVFVHAE